MIRYNKTERFRMLKAFGSGKNLTREVAQRMAGVEKNTSARNTINKLIIDGLLTLAEPVAIGKTKDGRDKLSVTYKITEKGREKLKASIVTKEQLTKNNLQSISGKILNLREKLPKSAVTVVYPADVKITVSTPTWESTTLTTPLFEPPVRRGALDHLHVASRSGDRANKYVPPVSMVSGSPFL
jgi:hypothetical protein